MRPIPGWPWKTVALDIFYHENDGYLVTVGYERDSFKIDLLRMKTISDVSSKLQANCATEDSIQVIFDGGSHFRNT